MSEQQPHDPTHPADPPAPPNLAADYDRHLAAAKALPAADVLPFTGDPPLLYANVTTGCANVLALRAELSHALPEARWDQVELAPSLAGAVWYAWILACTSVAARTRYLELAPVVRGDRSLFLSAAETLAKAGVLNADAVAEIAAGRGIRDAAQDVQALTKLFQDNATAITGKVPFDVARMATAQANATELLLILRPDQRLGDYAATGAQAEAADIRVVGGLRGLSPRVGDAGARNGWFG